MLGWAARNWPVIKWHHSADIMRTRLPQIAGLIPVLGYAVLWSDMFQQWLMRFDETLGAGLLSASMRIGYLYAGGVVILCGMLVFWAACPPEIRKFADFRAFANDVKETQNLNLSAKASNYILAHGKRFSDNNIAEMGGERIHVDTLEKGAAKYVHPSQHTSILRSYYNGINASRPILSLATSTLLVGGGLLFLVPSVEVFLLAFAKLAGRVFGS